MVCAPPSAPGRRFEDIHLGCEVAFVEHHDIGRVTQDRVWAAPRFCGSAEGAMDFVLLSSDMSLEQAPRPTRPRRTRNLRTSQPAEAAASVRFTGMNAEKPSGHGNGGYAHLRQALHACIAVRHNARKVCDGIFQRHGAGRAESRPGRAPLPHSRAYRPRCGRNA